MTHTEKRQNVTRCGTFCLTINGGEGTWEAQPTVFEGVEQRIQLWSGHISALSRASVLCGLQVGSAKLAARKLACCVGVMPKHRDGSSDSRHKVEIGDMVERRHCKFCLRDTFWRPYFATFPIESVAKLGRQTTLERVSYPDV